MKAFYADDGESDPDAEPGVSPESAIGANAPSVNVEVDGELFAIRPDKHGGTDYTWVTGPNPGYGFGSTPSRDLSLAEHRDNIRDFLAMVDPKTGYIQEN